MPEDTSVDETQDAPPAGEEQPEPFDPERAKAKIAKANAEAKNLRDRLRKAEEAERKLAEIEESGKTEAQKLSDELEKMRQENETLKATQLQAQVAADKGVPANLLSGSTVEELEASADALLEFKGPESKPDFGAGKRGDPVGGPVQISQDDLKSMSNEQINAARKDGRLDRLLGRIP